MKLSNEINLIDGKDERRKIFVKNHPELLDLLPSECPPEIKKTYVTRHQISREDYMYLKKIQSMDIADMRIAGMTLQEIGNKKGLTKERIRQILKQYFPKLNHGGPKKGCKNISKFCPECDLPFSGIRSRMIRRIYCSTKCKNKALGTHFGINIKGMTKEQYKIYNNKRTKEYYRKHCKDPVFKDRIRKYNRRARLKYFLLKGYINGSTYKRLFKKVTGKEMPPGTWKY